MQKKIILTLLGLLSLLCSLQSFAGYSKKYQFTDAWFDANIAHWTKVLAPYKGKNHLNYLEIGVWEGRSFFWMLENILTKPTSKAVALDLFNVPDATKRFQANLDLSGLSSKVTVVQTDSKLIPQKLQLYSFDLIYIDGWHSGEYTMRDAISTWDLLNVGGLMIFDDYAMGKGTLPFYHVPTRAIDDFIEFFYNELEVVYKGLQVVIKKRSPKCNASNFEGGNIVTPIGRYCYYWNYYQISNLSKGLYDQKKTKITLSKDADDKLQNFLRLHRQIEISTLPIFLKSEKELTAFLNCKTCKLSL